MKKKLTALFVKQAVRSLTRLSLGSNTQALMRKQIADLTRFGNQLVSMRSA